ncbi:MAG: hypothetical protein JRN20_10870, partial [Nitrososphaerota archaeon]|nr:hypothetical protein [Nitrososphaerota archaeon]
GVDVRKNIEVEDITANNLRANTIARIRCNGEKSKFTANATTEITAVKTIDFPNRCMILARAARTITRSITTDNSRIERLTRLTAKRHRASSNLALASILWMNELPLTKRKPEATHIISAGRQP